MAFGLDNIVSAARISGKRVNVLLRIILSILNDNQLSGTIPDTLSLVQTLEVIRLDKNKLTGTVPDNLNTLSSVTELYLANNDFSGPIPDLTGMNLLTYLDMSNNPFNASDVPQWLMALTNLTTLQMDNVRLSGNVPTELFSLPQLLFTAA